MRLNLGWNLSLLYMAGIFGCCMGANMKRFGWEFERAAHGLAVFL